MLILGLFATPMCGCGGDVNKGMNTAITREAIAMLSSAFSVNQLKKHPMMNSIGLKDLMTEMNYVTTTEEKQIDSVAGEQSFSCANAPFTCLQLHNGSILAFENQETFGGNQKNRAIKVLLDPDGAYSGKTTSPEDFNGNVKAVALYLYADGFIASDATFRPNTQSNLHHYKVDTEKVPL